MSSNRKVKSKLIKLFGKECFIDKLHLRRDTERHYTGKAQMEKMKRLTYHHIKMKKDGGRATVENGALLSEENHRWFHQQTKKDQERMNRMFQEYKKCKIEFTDDVPEIEVHYSMVKPSDISRSIEKQKKRDKKEFEKLRKEYEDR